MISLRPPTGRGRESERSAPGFDGAGVWNVLDNLLSTGVLLPSPIHKYEKESFWSMAPHFHQEQAG